MNRLQTLAPLAARLLIGGFFLLSGLGKLADVQGFAAYMQMGGLPAFLAWPAILFELLVGLSMITGFKVRLVALAGAGFCALTALLYHNNFADQMQMVMFLKNLAIAGGFLMIFGNGAGAYALDNRAVA